MNVMNLLPLIAFLGDVVNAIFLKYSMKGRLSSNQTGIHNIPSMFGMMTKNITRYNLNTGVFRTPYNISDGVLLCKHLEA